MTNQKCHLADYLDFANAISFSLIAIRFRSILNLIVNDHMITDEFFLFQARMNRC